MGIIVDLIIIAVLLLFVGMGYKKGLTGSLIKLASFAIALVLAFILYKPVGNMVIENTQIDEQIETLTEIIGELVKTYEELEEEERKYQENKRKFKNRVHDVRSMFSNKKKATEEDAESYFLELSYEISDKMNTLRAKTRRSAMEEEALIMLTKQLEEVTAKLVNNK